MYNYTEGTAQGTASAEWSCSPGCDEMRLGNTQCDVACNTSACIWDQGDCGYTGEYAMEELCAVWRYKGDMGEIWGDIGEERVMAELTGTLEDPNPNPTPTPTLAPNPKPNPYPYP